jgi:signal transduction histidine kinase/ActR/RegA family two-component response regulator
VIDLEAQAAIIAENVNSALQFHDRAAATATLSTLRGRRNVSVVCVYDEDGNLFASYSPRGQACAPARSLVASASQASIVAERESVGSDTKPVGTVIVAGSLVLFYEWVAVQAPAILGALIIGTMVAYLLTRRLQRVVSAPVLDLARTADTVSANRDYSLRAAKVTNDEVGGLVQSFNGMLDEIQHQNQVLTSEIAERKRAEQLKDAFLAAVSHELRTPLNAILGRLQLLRETSPTEEQLERALESLERNARSQARLVEDLLDVSRIAAGKFQMRFEVVDVRNVVTGAIDVLTPQAIAKSIRIATVIPDRPCLVSGDSGRLQQAVINLLSNAVKFSQGGVVGVDISTLRGTCEFAIAVQDAGIGIEPEFLPKVFDRFRQGDDSMTRQHGGLGLGLAIVKEVAELHGGSVAASSAGIGHGARFTIRLPQLIEADATGPNEDRGWLSSQPTHAPLHGLRVLVVDDEPDGLDVAATALGAAGASVAAALSGDDAIAQWTQGSFDAIVCDLAMPDMDGFQVLDRIAEIDHQRGRGPIAVALTAYASNEYRHRSLAAGFHAHLAKPYRTRDLVAALTDAVEKVRTQGSKSAKLEPEFR